MTRDQINAHCAAQPAATHVVQWGGSDVWKVGGKVFAVVNEADGVARVSFKASEIAFEALSEAPGMRPAPYMASRGMSWLQYYAPLAVSDADLQGLLERSHALAAATLSKKRRRELGLLDA